MTVLEDLERERRSAVRRLFGSLVGVAIGLPVALAPIWLPLTSAPARATHVDLRPFLEGIAAEYATTPGLIAGLGITWFLTGSAGLFLLAWRVGWQPCARYFVRFREQVFVAACAEHLPGVTFAPSEGFSWKAFEALGLFGYSVDQFRSANRFAGSWEGREITLSEIESDHETSRWSHGEHERSLETHFYGLLLTVALHASWHGSVRVIPRTLQRDEKRAWRLLEKDRPIGEPAFDARFRSLSTQPAQAGELLRGAIADRLVELAREDAMPRLHLSKDQMVLLLPQTRRIFRPSLFVRADDPRLVERFVSNVRAALEHVEIAP